MRVAFCGPLPPSPTGIADYDVDVLRALAGRHEITAFSEEGSLETESPRPLPGIDVQPASRLDALHATRPFDVFVHQMGNNPVHGYLYPLLVRHPGLLVLHDLVLHHARASLLLDSPEARAYAADPSRADLRDAARRHEQEYRAEAAWSHPAPAGRLAEVHLATVGRLLPYAYPLVRLPVEASRVVAAHNQGILDGVRADVPEAVVTRLVMPIDRLPVPPGAVDGLRQRYGIGRDETVVATFGLLTAEKQPVTVARAFSRAAALRPGLRLMLVGPVADRAALEGQLSSLGVAGRTIVTGRVPFDELAAHMELADVVAHLRYPTARETSAALLRVLAQGRPVVMSDLEHLGDVPEDAVVRADPTDEEGELTRALLRLAAAPALRRTLGERAASFVAREHTAARCAASYEAALALTARTPDPPMRAWPAHWRAWRGEVAGGP